MVTINEKKYACETCIKGHRSSACKHTDRPLFEIKKKGRPVTQCDHCRELRKTKQVHVKCLCEAKEEPLHPPSSSSTSLSSQPPSSKKVVKIPASAAFPNGLPPGLESLAAPPSRTEGTSSDSDRGSDHSASCACHGGGECNCTIERKRAPRKRKLRSPSASEPPLAAVPICTSASSNTLNPSQTQSILARIAELRPVLPRPFARESVLGGPLHTPSSGTHHDQPSRHSHTHHAHEELFFSPYGRAYDYQTGGGCSGNDIYAMSEGSSSTHSLVPSHFSNPVSYETLIRNDTEQNPIPDEPPLEQLANPQAPQNLLGAFTQGELQLPWNNDTGAFSFPTPCGCGDVCTCPGCSEHTTTTTSLMPNEAAFTQCSNPSTCSHCLDRSILSMPPSFFDFGMDTSLRIRTDEVNEWARAVSEHQRQSASSNDISAPTSGSEPSLPSGGGGGGDMVAWELPPSHSIPSSSVEMHDENTSPYADPMEYFLGIPDELGRSRTSSSSSGQSGRALAGGIERLSIEHPFTMMATESALSSSTSPLEFAYDRFPASALSSSSSEPPLFYQQQ